MIKSPSTIKRENKNTSLSADLVIVGGGLSGVCCAITAARAGVKVIIVTDRPVLGGNASSEVRLWVLGATSHMGNNNRWAREGGVIDELLVENMYRNAEGNPLIFDTILLEKVVSEQNISLLLNTSIYDLEKKGADKISKVIGFCSQNSTQYQLSAPLFCDASGDGILGFLAGAAFRMGAESKEEFGEKFAPNAEYGELLGHSMYFYSKDVGKPVKYIAPNFALDVTKNVPKFKSFTAQDFGCRLWWIEYGGRLDTVHDTELIKWELWKVVYGVWDYIKNSGKFPEAENLTLEWLGTIPGKRESRRFEGDFMLTQQDIVEQKPHVDDVAFGGWSIDLHPADGVFSELEKSSCNQWHSKGIYGIPLRCLYSKNVSNLFIAGRIISASHVAFGSCRVMATGAHGGQAIGMATKICIENQILPKEIISSNLIQKLQNELLKTGQHIPNLAFEDENDLAKKAMISASSELILSELHPNNLLQAITESVAQMFPISSPKKQKIIIHPHADEETVLDIELRISSKNGNYTPDVTISKQSIKLQKGRNCLPLEFDFGIIENFEICYAFLIIQKNEKVKLQYSDQRISGILSVFNTINPAVSNYGKQEPTEDIGVDSFEFWTPKRRPEGKNLAMKFEPAIEVFQAKKLINGIFRPTNQPNVWVADINDREPNLLLEWTDYQEIKEIILYFDTDFDHPMETVLIHHPENVMPFCVQEYSIFDGDDNLLFHTKNNHQSLNSIKLSDYVETKSIKIVFKQKLDKTPVSLFGVRVL